MKISSEKILTKCGPKIKEAKLPFWKYTSGQYRPNAPNQWDICYKYSYPYNILCNFTQSHFVFDNVEICSMEGFLQSLKVEDPQVQRKICTLPGFLAKKLGNYLKRTGQFDRKHLFWNGEKFERDSFEYQKLLERVYDSKYMQDKNFRDVLRLSKGYRLTHNIGKSNPNDTVLTEDEFIAILNNLRTNKNRPSIFKYLTDKIKKMVSVPNNPVAVIRSFKGIKTSPINGHFICGEPLFSKDRLHYINKKTGIRNIIEINVNNGTAEERKLLCKTKNIGYLNIGTDSQTDINTIKQLLNIYNNGGISYINCVERKDANIPLALNYLFNPKADISDAVIFGSPTKSFLDSMKNIGEQIYSSKQYTQSLEISDKQSFLEKLKILAELN